MAMRLKSFSLLKALSMRQRSLYRRLLKLNGCFLLQRLGMTKPVAGSLPQLLTVVSSNSMLTPDETGF